MALFKKLQRNRYKTEVDKLVLRGLSSKQIHTWLINHDPSVSFNIVDDYVINWPFVILLDAYQDYLWLCENLEGWTVLEFNEEDLKNNITIRNSFRRELTIARTEFRLRELYKNILVDEKTYKDLVSIILTAMAQQEQIHLKTNNQNAKNANNLNENNKPIDTNVTVQDVVEDVAAVDTSDLEKYLLKKPPQEQQVIRSFLSDMNKLIQVVNLSDYTPNPVS